MRRRDLLLASAGALAAPRAFAFGAPTKLDVCELDLPGTVSRPNAWKRLLYEVGGTTSVECEPRSVRLAPDDPALFEHPFAVLAGDGAFELSEGALEQLERYLGYGGFLDHATNPDQYHVVRANHFEYERPVDYVGSVRVRVW